MCTTFTHTLSVSFEDAELATFTRILHQSSRSAHSEYHATVGGAVYDGITRERYAEIRRAFANFNAVGNSNREGGECDMPVCERCGEHVHDDEPYHVVRNGEHICSPCFERE